jgi:branched-subunit amino acid transport protein
MDTTTLWLAILGAAAGTFAMRISFLGPWAKGRYPPILDKALRFAPPVIFAALITPMIVKTGVEVPTAQMLARLCAVAVTLTWALRFGGQVWPLAAGMATLHGVQFLLRA